MTKDLETATFAGGCFWGVEETFRTTNGVKETKVGFMGGHTKNPSYAEVCTDKTGHAEVVQLKYDPNEISYEKLLEIFWNLHDPTLLNRQGPDVGSQYRSEIFFHDKKQKELAEQSKKKLEESGKYKHEIVTKISSAS
jgi:peptide-methionine (S)-S-oxide reductase